MRRELPVGGLVKEDYVFHRRGADGNEQAVRLSELFAAGQDSLLVYSFMYGPDMKRPCPLCTSILDGLNGNAHHIMQRMSVAVAAKSPLDRIHEFADGRDWSRLNLVSTQGTTYNADYFGETGSGSQMPMANVFVRREDGIHHFWGSELLYHPNESGDSRHVDLLWPLWNVLDLTPEGRGADWYPKLSYP